MKDSEFIELLNLYIDHEIGAEDAARLEAEVLAHSGRRRIYQQYCRMHRACGLLAGQFREIAPLGEKILSPRRSTWAGAAAGAGLLAAACLAVVATIRFHHPAAVPANAVASAPAPDSGPSELASAPSVPLHPVLDLKNFNFLADSDRNVRLRMAASPASAALAAEQNQLFAWMNQVEMAPVQRPPLEQAFDAAPVLLGPESPAERQPGGLQAPVEKAAFRFER
jgi:hypothetical protein